MLSIGWPEMLIVAAAALIIVGPRDLPALLRQVGRVVGQVRRMGNEFRAEINKVAALDDVKDIKKSLTQPLADTRSSIEKEFNKMTPTGFEPSGVMKPSDPKVESVYDDIKAITDAPNKDPDPGEAARATMTAAVTKAMQGNASKAAAAAAETKSVAAPKTATGAKAKAPAKTGAASKSGTKAKAETTAKGTAAKSSPEKKSASASAAPAKRSAARKSTAGKKPASGSKASGAARKTTRKPRSGTKA